MLTEWISKLTGLFSGGLGDRLTALTPNEQWVLVGMVGVALVGALIQWHYRQVCVGVFAAPVLLFAVLTWPLGPIIMVVCVGFVWAWARQKGAQAMGGPGGGASGGGA